MAFSTQRVISDGTLSSLDISIDYFERDEISVFFDNIVDALPWAWVGLTEKTLSFSPDVPNGVEVLVRRTTPLAEVFHDFDGGAAFVAKTVDENFKQVLHIAQEAVEGGTTGDFFNDLNMHGYKITNLANPVDPGDAVNLSRFTLQENLVITYRNQTIVYRDQAEAFAIAAAASASSVDTARTISLSGDVSGSASFDGSANATINTSIAAPASGNWFNGIPRVGSDGVMEIGKYVDFHETSATTADYDGRLFVEGGGELYYSKSGDTPNLVYHSGNINTANAGTATKLQTARTLTIGNTGKSFDGSANVSWSLAEIGAAGFGVLADGTDLNAVVASGFYRLLGTHGNAPPGVSHGQLIVSRGGGDTILQIVTGHSNGEIYWRQGNPPDVGGGGSWSAWHRFFHSGNLDPATYAPPPGMVAYFARNTAPSGWLKANGAAVSRTTYEALFAAIGTTFGAGDGSTTFNLPDLRAEFIRGWDDGRGVDSGRAFGSSQAGQMPSHTHTQEISNSTSGGLNRGPGSTGAFQQYSGTTTAAGGTENSSENRPRNIALLACIKY